MADAPAGGADPRPAPDPAASPQLAPDPAPPPPRRRPVAPAVVAAIAAAGLVAGVVAWALAPRPKGATPAGRDGVVLEPIRPRAEGESGEQVAPFSGFAVSVDTDPSGALVIVDGVPRGEAPVLAGVECAPGAPIEIAAEKTGFPVGRTSTPCRRDALVKLTIRLRR